MRRRVNYAPPSPQCSVTPSPRNHEINDPTVSLYYKDILTPRPVIHRPAIIKPEPFGALLRAIDGYSGQPETRLALQLLRLVFVRPGELRSAEW